MSNNKIFSRSDVIRMTVGLATLVLAGLGDVRPAFGQDRYPFDQVHSDLYDAEVVEFSVDGAKAFVVKPRRPAALFLEHGLGSGPNADAK